MINPLSLRQAAARYLAAAATLHAHPIGRVQVAKRSGNEETCHLRDTLVRLDPQGYAPFACAISAADQHESAVS